jgi:hypothetical protein
MIIAKPNFVDLKKEPAGKTGMKKRETHEQALRGSTDHAVDDHCIMKYQNIFFFLRKLPQILS